MVEEIRYKRSKQVDDNLNKQEIPEHLQAGGSDIQHVGNVYTNTSLSKHGRKKRGLLGIGSSHCRETCHNSHRSPGIPFAKEKKKGNGKGLGEIEVQTVP